MRIPECLFQGWEGQEGMSTNLCGNFSSELKESCSLS